MPAASLAFMPKLLAILVWGAVTVLISAVLVFAGIRLVHDLPHLLGGTAPDEQSFGAAYVSYPVLAYLHIVPGVLFLLGAVFQLSSRFRDRHWAVHRRLGRVLVALGTLSGAFALLFGIPFGFGGPSESLATAVFGSWFLFSIVSGFFAIRRRDVVAHRRWMIRAFAIGLGVGTIRAWVGVLSGLGPLSLAEGLAWGFWLGLSLHALAAEMWLRARPRPSGRARVAAPRRTGVAR